MTDEKFPCRTLETDGKEKLNTIYALNTTIHENPIIRYLLEREVTSFQLRCRPRVSSVESPK